MKNTPGLWKHKTRPVTFTLVADDFGMKHEKMSDAVHLINALKKHYDLETDWTGKLHCGIHLKWNHVGEPWAEMSMPGCVEQKPVQFGCAKPTRPQHAPCPSPPPSFGKTAQEPPPEDTAPLLCADGTKRVQQIVGSNYFTDEESM